MLYEKIADGIWVHRNPLFLIAVTSALIGMQSVGTGILAELIVRTHVESQRKTSLRDRLTRRLSPEPTKG